MKENIDLTLNNDFSRDRSRTIDDISTFILNKRSLYPWNGVYSIIHPDDLTFSRGELELVYTGNAEDRESKKFSAAVSEGSLVECDRCGAYLKNYPWTILEFNLCDDCIDSLEYRYSKEPWKRR